MHHVTGLESSITVVIHYKFMFTSRKQVLCPAPIDLRLSLWTFLLVFWPIWECLPLIQKILFASRPFDGTHFDCHSRKSTGVTNNQRWAVDSEACFTPLKSIVSVLCAGACVKWRIPCDYLCDRHITGRRGEDNNWKIQQCAPERHNHKHGNISTWYQVIV